jgi:hypothetical protein
MVLRSKASLWTSSEGVYKDAFERSAIERVLVNWPSIYLMTHERYPNGEARFTPTRAVSHMIIAFNKAAGEAACMLDALLLPLASMRTRKYDFGFLLHTATSFPTYYTISLHTTPSQCTQQPRHWGSVRLS